MDAKNQCVECGKEICGCGSYRRHYGTDDIPPELRDWMPWDDLETEHPHSRKWFELVLRAVQAWADEEISWLETEYAAEYGPQDDEDGFSPAWQVIRDEWEALKRTAGICDGVHSDA